MHVSNRAPLLNTLDASAGGNVNVSGGEYDIDVTLGDIDLSNATMLPGSSPGLMTFDGSLTTNNVSLEIEIGGLIASADYDRVEVTG